MALIECPECKHKISSSAISCPNCGFCNKNTDIPNKENCTVKLGNCHTSKSFMDKIKYVISFEWVEDITNWLDNIPKIGNTLGCLFDVLIVLLIVAGIAVTIGWLLYSLYKYSISLFAVVCAIGLNIGTFFASYRWGTRKEWFFWVGLFLTVICLFKILPTLSSI